MVQLDFKWTVPYGYDETTLRPLLTVRLISASVTIDATCLLDTGAERTLLDGRVLHACEVDLWAGRDVELQGFMGAGVVVYEHDVRIGLKDVVIGMPICFSTGPIARQVLGRDVLALFQVGLRERYQEIYLSPEP